uniref:Peptidase S8/S53 domain-containing protein n=1 Tax=Fagus sylvatica TaxID=28930 RepID=A0A2N9GTF4_FAGSY
MEFRQTFTNVSPAPVVTPTGSRGPSRHFPWILKPDMMAPGHLVLGASLPKNTATQIVSGTLRSDYIIASGISAACAHATGVAALQKSAHPDWSPAAIRSAIVTTANPLDNTLRPIRDGKDNLPASPLVMGAGHIDPNKALDPGAAIYEAIVTAPEDYVVTVSPATLVFGKKYEIQSYNITLMGIGSENRKISFGELVWSEESGNHKVRSPIVLFHLGLL